MTRTYPEEDLLWRHLKTVPAFRALLRAVEARFYRALSIPEPVLDLGCGDGHFAKMIFDSPLAAGVDPWWGPLQKARRAGVYRLNVQAVGDRLPFADQSFGSVISNSVLEHIPDVEPVLRESARVLRPGGQLVVTMPSHLFTEHLGGAALLAPLGLADNYRDFFNTISRHAHTDPPETWAARMGRAGFEVERWQYYFSRRALRALELGHLQGLPSAAIHALTGHWILGPWRDNLALTERWVRPYYEEPFPEEGAYILMVARKVADGAVAAVLPPQEQFTLEQLQAAQPAPEAEEESSFQPEGISDSVVPAPSPAPSPATGASVPVAPPPAALERAPGEPTTRPADGVERADTPPAAEREAAAAGKRPLLPALAILALAVLGQLVLSGQPSTPVAGLWFYGGALALLIASTLLRRRSGDYRLPRPAIRRRTLLFYPPALLLGFLAQRQVGLSLDGGRAALAFLLWFSAIGLALYALWKPTTATEDTPADGAPVTGGRVTTRPPAARRQQLMNLLIPS
ncbi:MAG: methyltransferase domain-containing protein, partial [Candidatus Promineifilaceae bacterium]|nr:methyltransferase domain-containing protein [Candidatus Promineifilaceae bacterium]